MIVLFILLYLLAALLEVGIFGGLLAFILLRPDKGVTLWALALGVLLFSVLSDMLMHAIVSPLDLTLTTANPLLIRIFGTSDLTFIMCPSFRPLDIGLYAINVVIGVYIGKIVVRWKMKQWKSEGGFSPIK